MKKAQQAYEEALKIYRDLAEKNPEVYLTRGPLDFRAKSVGGRPLFSRVI
jgi:hypothetical protein